MWVTVVGKVKEGLVGLKKAGSTDKGLFGLGTLSVAFWGGVKKVGWGVS